MTRKASKTPIVDGAGHVDPKLREGLRERGHVEKEPVAFLGGHNRSSDPLAELMGEAVIEVVTGGEDGELAMQEAVVTEEDGGPFIETTDEVELSKGGEPPTPRTP